MCPTRRDHSVLKWVSSFMVSFVHHIKLKTKECIHSILHYSIEKLLVFHMLQTKTWKTLGVLMDFRYLYNEYIYIYKRDVWFDEHSDKTNCFGSSFLQSESFPCVNDSFSKYLCKTVFDVCMRVFESVHMYSSLSLCLAVCVFLCKWKMDRECWNKRCTWLWNGMRYGGWVVVVWNLFILLVFSSGYKRSTHKLNVLKRTERDISNRLCFRHSYKSFVTNERLCILNGNREQKKAIIKQRENGMEGKEKKEREY